MNKKCRKKGNRLRKVMASLLVVSSLVSYSVPMAFASNQPLPYVCGFDEQNIGDLPASIKTTGEVYVTEQFGEKALMLKNDNDGDMVSAAVSFDNVSGEMLTTEVSVLQKSLRTNGNVYVSFLNGSSEIAAIVSKNDALVYRSGKTEFALIDAYMPNKWYDITFIIDFNESIAKVFIDGKCILSNAPLEGGYTYCDGVSSYTKYSPGFLIDDLKIYTDITTSKVGINGNTNVVIPSAGTNKYTYKATAYNSYFEKIGNSDFSWSIEPAGETGITLVENSNGTATLNIEAGTTYTGLIELKAVDNTSGITGKCNVIVANNQGSKIVIDAPHKLYHDADTVFMLQADIYDDSGCLITNDDVSWSVTDGSELGVSVDGGVINVSKALPDDESVTIRAELVSNPKISSSVTIPTFTIMTYQSDELRFGVLKNSLNNVLDYGHDIYNDSPLLATGINLGTGTLAEYKSVDGTSWPFANVANQTNLYRSFYALAELTGEEFYAERINEIYEWMLNYGLSDNNLPYWGGHAAIDLKTLKKHESNRNPNTHELKDHMPYMTPFFELDKEKTSDIIRAIMCLHIEDWEAFAFDRHGYYDADIDLTNWYALNLDDVNKKLDTRTKFTRYRGGIPFRSSGNDFIKMAFDMYFETGDEKALACGKWMLDSYYSLRNRETGLVPQTFTTGKDSGEWDPQETFRDDFTAAGYDYYWQDPRAIGTTQPWNIGDPKYGDRFFNIFAEDLVDQGFYSAEYLDTTVHENLLEGNWINSSTLVDNTTIIDLGTAERFMETDPEYGRYIQEVTVKNIAGYVKYAWEKGTYGFHSIMADGTKLTGFKPKRNGYFGEYYNQNYTFTTSDQSSPSFFTALCKAYSVAKSRDDLAEEAEIIGELLSFYAETKYKLGSLGTDTLGDDGCKLDMNTTMSDPIMLINMLDLYIGSGNEQFLNVARRMADNMISAYYRYGIFSKFGAQTGTGAGKNYVVQMGGYNSDYYYALAYLEATIQGRPQDIPTWYFYDGYYHDYWLEDNKKQTDTYDAMLWGLSNKPISVTEIVTADTITLKVGEIVPIEYTVYPDDATTKALNIFSHDSMVALLNQDDQTIYGMMPGTTELTLVSADLNVSKRVRVIVE